jgi:uncharacterized protein (UPF0332 family)
MEDVDDAAQYVAKAMESFAGASSEFSNGRFNNSANRSYYACFQFAIAALMQAGIRPQKRADRWPHSFVISQFVGKLIHKRHQFPHELRRELGEIQAVRQVADYKPEAVSEIEAYRTLRRARIFVDAGRQSEGSTE